MTLYKKRRWHSRLLCQIAEFAANRGCKELSTAVNKVSDIFHVDMRLKEARGSFFGHGVEVLKLQSRIQDKL